MSSFKCGPHTYDFEFHNSGYSGPRYLAVNVKVRGFPSLTPKYERRLDQLREGAPEAYALCDLSDWAWEDVQGQWWEDARELAKNWGVGPVHGGGRSGGWLLVQNFPEDRVETLAEEYEAHCVHCTRPYREHGPRHKCLFSATAWESNEPRALQHLDRLQGFCDAVKRTLLEVPDSLRHALEYEIYQAWHDVLVLRRKKRAPAAAVPEVVVPKTQRRGKRRKASA